MTNQPEQNGKLLRFGLFELDAASSSLRKSGTLVRLQDQPARVLLHLLGRRGAVVTRDELQRALWPGDTFVDFDHGLNTAVNKIRDALGDSASSPRFIETVPKKGYRFIAPVEEVRPTPVQPAVPDPVKRPSRWVWAAGLVLLVAGLTGAWFLAAWREDGAPKPVVTPLTSLPGSEWGPSLSPDGERVAFCWNGPAGDNFDIYVKQIGSEQLARITTNPAVDSGPAWSPDGRWIAFARVVSGARRELVVVPSMGGVEKKVTEFHASDEAFKSSAASWGPDSRWLVLSDLAGTSKFTYSLHSVSVQTGERRELTFPPGDVRGDLHPAVSPDGGSIAFLRRTRAWQSELSMIKLAPGQRAAETPVRLLAGHHAAGKPVWTRDGKELIFQFGRVHLPHLARLRVGEQRPSRMEFAGELTGMPSISLREDRLSFVRVVWDANIWRHTIGARGSGATARWPGSSTYLDHVPRYSPDGRRIAFISNRSGIPSLWVCEIDGSNAVRLSDFKDEEIGNINWTPDGRRILANAGGKGYAFDARNGTAQPLPAPGFAASGDGKWFYFSSKQTGQDEIWKMPLAGGSPIQMTRTGGLMGTESADGKYLYYARNDGGTSLWRIPIAGGVEQNVLDALSTPMNFDVTGEGIYFIPPAQQDGRSAIQFLGFASGKVETVTELDKQVMWGFSVSRDRRSILFTQIDQSNTDLMLVDNFR